MRCFFICTILISCFLSFSCGLSKYISYQHYVIPTESMSPTLNKGDHFMSIGIRDNNIDPIERFNIVVFNPPVNENLNIDGKSKFVFRVIALGGEKVEIKEGIVFINDKPLYESSFKRHPSNDNFEAINVPENEYFLMGDNRPNSADSRFIGTITRENIDGKVDTIIISKEDWDKGKRW